MFKEFLKNMKPFNLNELNGKTLTMTYVEEDEHGILAGKDEDGKIYVIQEVKPTV